MRRNGALAADYAKRHGVPRWYDDAEKLIRDPEVDAVYVATPPDSHAHYTLAALAAGKPCTARSRWHGTRRSAIA